MGEWREADSPAAYHTFSEIQHSCLLNGCWHFRISLKEHLPAQKIQPHSCSFTLTALAIHVKEQAGVLAPRAVYPWQHQPLKLCPEFRVLLPSLFFCTGLVCSTLISGTELQCGRLEPGRRQDSKGPSLTAYMCPPVYRLPRLEESGQF